MGNRACRIMWLPKANFIWNFFWYHRINSGYFMRWHDVKIRVAGINLIPDTEGRPCTEGGPYQVSTLIPVGVESWRHIFNYLTAFIAGQLVYLWIDAAATPPPNSKSMCLNCRKPSNALIPALIPLSDKNQKISWYFPATRIIWYLIRWYQKKFQIRTGLKSQYKNFIAKTLYRFLCIFNRELFLVVATPTDVALWSCIIHVESDANLKRHFDGNINQPINNCKNMKVVNVEKWLQQTECWTINRIKTLPSADEGWTVVRPKKKRASMNKKRDHEDDSEWMKVAIWAIGSLMNNYLFYCNRITPV